MKTMNGLAHEAAGGGYGVRLGYPALVISQENPFSAHLVHQGPDLGVLEFDDLQLPAVDPAGENEEEELPGA